MFVRFTTGINDPDSHLASGIFHSVLLLCEREPVDEYLRKWMEESCQWFNEHLPVANLRDAPAGRAICWFKDSALWFIAKARELCVVLKEHGVPVRQVTTRRPGYIYYEDRYQIAAVPFRRGA
jgi:hypothetical protein